MQFYTLPVLSNYDLLHIMLLPQYKCVGVSTPGGPWTDE
jgi:hypothetical protein